MKNLILLSVFMLTGCYLANGSPLATNYWKKNNEKISIKEITYCNENISPNFDDRYIYLSNKIKNQGFSKFYQNKLEVAEYENYLEKHSELFSQCYYDLGYRFRPPIYWCLAQDGDNSRTCWKNNKYYN